MYDLIQQAFPFTTRKASEMVQVHLDLPDWSKEPEFEQWAKDLHLREQMISHIVSTLGKGLIDYHITPFQSIVLLREVTTGSYAIQRISLYRQKRAPHYLAISIMTKVFVDDQDAALAFYMEASEFGKGDGLAFGAIFDINRSQGLHFVKVLD